MSIEVSELGELKEEEIIWGDMELDVQNKTDIDITESDDGNHGAVTAKAKRSSLLTMEIKRASAVSSSAKSMRSLSINDERVGLALLEPSEHHGYGGGNFKYITNRHSNNGNHYDDDHPGRIPQSAPVSSPMWMRRSHSCFVTEAEKQEAAKKKKKIQNLNQGASGYGGGEGGGEENGSDHHEVCHYGDDLNDSNEKNDNGVGGGRSWIPPHEIVARSQSMTFSVCEGAGRTLKGMDLRRVRNAVWSRTGFVD